MESKFFPYIAEETIERDAEALLAEFTKTRDIVIAPPIPIEDIVEKYLKLSLEFDDTHRLFGLGGLRLGNDPDILGAIFFGKRRIVIDERLDPDERPAMEGRFRFTLAHEGCGHWRLHKSLFDFGRNDPAASNVPSVICRSSQSRERPEWQADYYASCVLMPRCLVYGVWHEHFGDTKARVFKRRSHLDAESIKDAELRLALETQERCRDDEALDAFLRPFAQRFKVSPIAMRIRLQQLGLLRRSGPVKRPLVEPA